MMRLQPYSHQVTGHAFLLTTEDNMTICKVMHRNELHFYLNMDRSLLPFTPEFRGIVDVTVCSEREGKYEFEAHFTDKRKENRKCGSMPEKNKKRTESSMGKKHSLSPVKYSGLDPSKFHEVPGFRSNQYTEDVKYKRPVFSDIGRNPWVQRVQRMGRHKNYNGNTIPYILLENLGGRFENPCILDLKMGTQIYGWDCTDSKIQNHLEKNKLTTTATIGIRLTGLQVYQEGAYICRDKFYGRGLSNAGLKETFRMFFSDGKELRKNIMDCVIEKVERVKSVVSELESYRLYGSSMVIFYEGSECFSSEDDSRCKRENNNNDVTSECCQYNDVTGEACRNMKTDVRVVDFAQSMLTADIDRIRRENEEDNGFILGLSNFLKMVREIKEEGVL